MEKGDEKVKVQREIRKGRKERVRYEDAKGVIPDELQLVFPTTQF
jgi:hypothetical protein